MTLIKPREKAWPRIAGWLAPPANCTALQYRIVERAFHDLGICEVPPGSNRGGRIDSMNKDSGSPLGSYWCANWVGRVYQDCGVPVPASYGATRNWRKYVDRAPSVGAAIVYGRPPSLNGHIGIVVRLAPYLLTIEGNRSWGGGTGNNGEAVDIGRITRSDIIGYVPPEKLVRLFEEQGR